MTTGRISKAGERLFEAGVLEAGEYGYTKIPSFHSNPDFWILQKKGIDYLVDPDLMIELKSRSRTYNDILLETVQDGSPGWIYTAKANLLVNIWLDTKSCAVIDLRALQLWWGMESPEDYREVSATNHRGEVSRSRIIPFSSLRFVPYKRATLPVDDPGEFLTLN